MLIIWVKTTAIGDENGKTPMAVITISREPGAFGEEIAARLNGNKKPKAPRGS